jgi:hypothetical protein
MREIALQILESPKDYTFKITSTAASYLVEHFAINFPPLLTMEDELNLHISA